MANIARPPVCSCSVRMSGVFGHDVGAHEVDGPRRQLLEVRAQLPRRLAPREVRVALVEADLGEALHHAWPGERLGEEDRLRRLGADRRDHPLPERERLGVRVVDPEHGDAVGDPEADHVGEPGPQALPVGALEVERVDVLVLLRRVLGVLDRAVGSVGEPRRVLGDPRVVGRALERDVERQLDAAVACGGGELDDVVDRAELGVDRGVPAVGAADRPRAAGVVGRRRGRVVAALALGDADRVDRAAGTGRRTPSTRRSRAGRRRRRACRARWPGRASSGGRTRTTTLKRARTGSTSTSTGLASSAVGTRTPGAPEQRLEVEPVGLRLDVVEIRDVAVGVRDVGRRQVAERAHVARRQALAELGERLRRRRRSVARRKGARRARPMPICRSTRDVDAGVELELHAVAPRAEVVEPADDLVLPATEPIGHERRREAVVAERRSWGSPASPCERALGLAAHRRGRRRRGRGRR